MGSTRAPHHAGQRPALPGAMCTRSPAAVAPIMPVTACIVGAGLKPAPTNDGFHQPTAPCGPAARAPRSNVHTFTRCCRTDHARHRMHSGAGFKPAPTNDGFHPPTAPCGPAARAPRSDVHPFTRCCRTDHARHRMHSGGRFETCPHYGVLMRQTMGSTNPPHHAGQRPALPGSRVTGVRQR